MSPETSLMLLAGTLPVTVAAYIAVGVLPPWWAARSVAPLGFFDVLRMRFAGVNAWWVVKVVAAAKARGEELHYDQVGDAYLDGVDLRAVHAAMTTPPIGPAPAESFAVLANRFRHGGPIEAEVEEADTDDDAHRDSSGASSDPDASDASPSTPKA